MAKFCAECGSPVEGMRFCSNCSHPLAVPASPVAPVVAAPSKRPGAGIAVAGIVFGIMGVLMPFFAAVFLVPVSLVCGAIAMMRGRKGQGFLGVALGILGFCGIVYTSQQITGAIRDPFSSEPRTGKPSGITAAQYGLVGDGMEYEQVVRLLGRPGEQLSQSNIAGINTVMYSWTNPNGSNMNVIFQNGRLVNKAQFGLR
jgi:hypothetical protein